MAGSKSNYLENEMLDHVLGGGDFTRPSSVFVALYTTAPSDTGGGVEVSAPSYAREEVANNPTNWPAAVDGLKTNGADIVFETAAEAWGTIVAFGLFDNVSAGNLLYWGELTASKLIDADDTAFFRAGTLTITED